MLLRRSNSFRREVGKRSKNAERSADLAASSAAGLGTVSSKSASPAKQLHSGLVVRLNGKKWSSYFAVAFDNAICLYFNKSEWTSFRSFPSEVLLLNALRVEAATVAGRDHCIRLSSASSDATHLIALSSEKDCSKWLRCLSVVGASPQVSRPAWVDADTHGHQRGNQVLQAEEELTEAKRKLRALISQREKLELEAKDILDIQLKNCLAL